MNLIQKLFGFFIGNSIQIFGTVFPNLKKSMLLEKSSRTSSLIAIFIIVIVVSACNLLKSNDSAGQPNSGYPQQQPTRDANAVPYFASVEEINKIKAVFTEKVGGDIKPLYIYFLANYAELQAQDPKKPENVDQYSYRDDAFDRQIPVKLSGPGKLEDNLFNLNDVALEKIPELVKDALERSKDLENPKVSIVRIALNPSFIDQKNENKPEISINIEGTRKNAAMKADAQGKVLDYHKY